MIDKFKSLNTLITNKYSGGVKLMELIPDMIELGFSKENILDIERLLRRYPESGLTILNYTWHPCNREKLFIYTPF